MVYENCRLKIIIDRDMRYDCLYVRSDLYGWASFFGRMPALAEKFGIGEDEAKIFFHP